MTPDVCHIPLLSKLSMTQCDSADTLSDVSQHLMRLLNTRQGDSLSNPEYGLVDLVDLLAALPQSAEHIGQSIEQCIRRFEPRLQVHAVTLTHDAPRHTLQFAIQASLAPAMGRAKIGRALQLCARMDEYGHIEVDV